MNNTYLVDSGGYSTHVGQADMYFKDGKLAKLDWTPKNIKDKSKADPVLDAVAQKYHSIAFESATEVVAKTKDKLDGFRSNIRTKETTLADLLTDAMRETGEADIALMNGGGIRESIPAGKRLVIITTSDGSALDKDKYYKVATNITFTTAETAMRN